MIRVARRWVLTSAVAITGILIMAVPGQAQDASLSGTISDATGGVLPGVTVTVTHEASGTASVTTTDNLGGFQVPLRVGTYSITAELTGFTTVKQTGLTLLVGQQVVIKMQMMPASVQETVTVSGEAPLVNISQSKLGSNIDQRQVADLPVNGRNWLDLTMLAPGSRLNSVGEQPATGNVGNFQLNLDGQQMTQASNSSFGQPRYNKDAIAEFEFVANRFDATQGRSAGIQVNAVTKSGTNKFQGTLAGYFRDDRFNEADFIANRVLPYSDQQVSTTFGGPILKDKFHFFANYEYERQPLTFPYNSPYPSFNIDQSGPNIQHKGGGRLDYQLESKTHLALRFNKYRNDYPFDTRYSGGSTRHPSSAIATVRHSTDAQATITRILSNRAANDTRIGWASFYWTQDGVVRNPKSPNAFQGKIFEIAPIINLQGYTIGVGNTFMPQYIGQDVYSVRDDLTFTYSLAGRHTLKVGGEWLLNNTFEDFGVSAMGIYDATLGARPANLEALFPVWNDVSTWNLNALNPIIRNYQLGVGTFVSSVARTTFGNWIQDDWTPTPKLTVNVGLRYDYASNLFAQKIAIPPFLQAGRPNEKNDFGPRLGAVYAINDRTVVRGGWGKYFSDVQTTTAIFTTIFSTSTTVQVANDQRADFATNPFNGPIPTFQQAISGGARRAFNQGIVSPNQKVPYSYQSSIGIQQQIGNSMSLQADYVDSRDRLQGSSRNINLIYNPVTGFNYPFNDRAHLFYAGFDQVNMIISDGQTNYHALELAFTKRFTQNWQASATYTYAREYRFQPAPSNPGCQYPLSVAPTGGTPTCNTAITLLPDLQAQWFRTGEQANRLVFNGIWDIKYGFQLSGLYFFGDNGMDQATAGVDARLVGSTAGRVRSDGTIIPRFGINRADLHRVDLRLMKRFKLGPKVEVSGILDTFNLFNHKNYGTYVVNERSATFGQPTTDTGTAYQPRIVQLGFRTTF